MGSDTAPQAHALAPAANTAALDAVMGASPVISVVVLDELKGVETLAEILVEHGFPAIEVTLRTGIATAAIRAMSHVDGAIVGAGTVLSPEDAVRAVGAGAKFLVSPGLSSRVVRAAFDLRAPILPGVATSTEIMQGLDLGLSRFKFFPAAAAGGLPMLKAIQGPFPQVRFCPTGGVTASTLQDYLSLPNVSCVGGTWIAPRGPFDASSVRAAASTARDIVQRVRAGG